MKKPNKTTTPGRKTAKPPDLPPAIPAGFVVLAGLQAGTVIRRLGYVGSRPLIIFSYHRDAAAVIWKDDQTAGFGGVGADYFLEDLVTQAGARGASLSDNQQVGSHVIVVEQRGGTVYVAPRICADEYLATSFGRAPPSRRCICALNLQENQGHPCTHCPGPAGLKPVPGQDTPA